MDFENELTSKILDHIHGTIRLTTLEIAFINHPLFQRLRNIKQNSFLYKVFPSAVHSRFEHSLGVLHLSSEILNNLRLNAIRYQKKYDDGHVFGHIDQIPKHNIQELRLAALMHDIGHGPVSHQFESFMPGKHEFSDVLPTAYHSIIDVLSKPEQKVEHEQLSLLFSLMIYHDLRKQGKVDDEINIENVLKIIEKRYGDQQIIEEINGKATDILPLMTSIISSCPIDADRMDYLLRDGYFSGVKCGIYDYNRLFMSIVPVEEQGKLYLAYKESGIDSIAEFIGARSSLFSQVYYHKTNRAFATMLSTLCEIMQSKDPQNVIIADVTDRIVDHSDESFIDALKDFYLACSDDYFLNDKVGEWIDISDTEAVNKKILDDIINRHPWSKVYEAKHSVYKANIADKENKAWKSQLTGLLTSVLQPHFKPHEFAVDIVSDCAFKDLDKTEVKLLVKDLKNRYEIKPLIECGDKLNQYQIIKYCIRVFVDRDIKERVTPEIIYKINEIVVKQIALLN
ncbi:TPA: HD domain-containing protein [Klebsiella pneumoniae]